MVRSTMEYCGAIWDPFLQKDVNALERVQRRGARFVRNKYLQTESVTKLLEELGWEDLAKRRLNSRLTIIYKIMNGHVAVPAEDLYITRSHQRTRATNNAKLQTIRATTREYQHATIPRTIPHWNRLPQAAIDANNTTEFKAVISSYQ